ncbi:LysR family transcriptional regulator for bpeEF and oprC [Paraburkholderia sp. GAS199]|uniref:LysR family transcriptional regulator n=1 Tax=Paraburkholderia sp. GAS199 TaxID=3035126 RepID=UPI003D22CEF0
MDRLNAMLVFTRVVESGSFARAADTLDLARASVTVIIQNLESHLKVRLINRSTRQLSLTSEGEALYEQCVKILADVAELESSFTNGEVAPGGKLRVDVPCAIAKAFIIPALHDFRDAYRDIELTLSFADRPVDIIQNGIDCALRLGPLGDSSLVARRIRSFARITVASPTYLRHHGLPLCTDDLRAHNGVRYLAGSANRSPDMSFTVGRETVDVNLNNSVSVTDFEGYLACGLNGLGLIQCPRFMALPYLLCGQFVEVLEHFRPSPVPLSVVYPRNRHLSKTVRAFVDWTVQHFQRTDALDADERPPTAHDRTAPAEQSVVVA